MANYKETTGQATAWKRCKLVTINNDYSGTKRLMFVEEDIIKLDDKYASKDGRLLFTNYDSQKLITLRDPSSGEATGEVISEELIYKALYSLYIELAQAKDLSEASNIELVNGFLPPGPM